MADAPASDAPAAADSDSVESAVGGPVEFERRPDEDDVVAYVRYVVTQLVDNPDAVEVTEAVEDGERYIDIDVHPDDRGRVIGRDGRLIRSLRVVVRAASGRRGSPATVDVLEDDDDDNGVEEGGDAASGAEDVERTGDTDDDGNGDAES